MARVPYVTEQQAAADPLLASLYADAASRRGSVLNLYRAIANQPGALQAHLAMSRYVRDDSSLRRDLRELAILATGHALGAEYEQVQHAAAARAVGVSEAKIAAFPDWNQPGLFSAEELAVLSFADEVARTRAASDAVYQDVIERFGMPGMLDLLVTCAFYHYCAAILGVLQLETDLNLK